MSSWARHTATALLVSGTLLLGACGPAASITPAPTPAGAVASPQAALNAPSPQASPVTSPSPAAQNNPAVDAALREAATYLGVPATSLTVERVEPRDWPDAALGCPRPDVMYAQVVTPGYLVVISGAGKVLEYHTDAQGTRVALCQER